MKNIRWKVFTVVGVFALFFLLGVYPILASRYSLPAPAWRDSVSKIENVGASARTVPSSSSIVRVRTSRSTGSRTACERPDQNTFALSTACLH